MHSCRTAVLAIISIVTAAASSLRAAELSGTMTAQDLIRTVETQYQGKTSKAVMKMKVVTESWTREMTMESWSEGRDRFLIRILSPKKDQGVSTLKIGDDMWNYLPKIDRLMKIPSSLMGENWMGSHLTNDDLVKGDKIDELYTFNIVKREGDLVTVRCTPKPDAAVVWGSILYTIDLDKTVPVVIDYYDEDGALVRKIDFDRIEKIAGRWIPLVMQVKPIESPGEMTEMVYDQIEFDITLDKDLFSVTTLRRK